VLEAILFDDDVVVEPQAHHNQGTPIRVQVS